MWLDAGWRGDAPAAAGADTRGGASEPSGERGVYPRIYARKGRRRYGVGGWLRLAAAGCGWMWLAAAGCGLARGRFGVVWGASGPGAARRVSCVLLLNHSRFPDGRAHGFAALANIGVLRAGRAQPLYLLTPSGRFALRATAHRADASLRRASGRFGPSAQQPTGLTLPCAPCGRSQRLGRPPFAAKTAHATASGGWGWDPPVSERIPRK